MKRFHWFKIWCLIALLLVGNTSIVKAQGPIVHPTTVTRPAGFAISGPIKENPVVSPESLPPREVPINRQINPNIPAPVFSKLLAPTNEQTSFGTLQSALSTNFAGQSTNSYPPDANGAVNEDYYFQVVNVTYTIYDKSDGSIVAGPSLLNSIFDSSLPGANRNDGDPIVLWDEHVNRWLYAEFSIGSRSGGNDYMLIAVSTSSDPTGSWYSWSYDVDDMPDYPKFGIWQDGYYMATNNRNGNDVYVFERDSMLVGTDSPRMLGFDNPNRPSTFDGFHCILPLDNDGPWAPAGTSGQFITIADDGQGNTDDALYLYTLDVDWDSTGNSTFSRTQTLDVNAFNGNFNGTWNSIPQKGTSQKLDALSTVLMHRAQYRNFNGTQKIVCNHTIAVSDTQAAIRWYVLENTGTGWSINQQSTYNTDNLSRWDGSIAMNAEGDIALGYSVSGSSIHPGIRYTGRLSAATANTMNIDETTIWTGNYSQQNYNRWGDYANISVDPSDNETFWFTTEYKAASTNLKGTRIAAFSFRVPVMVDQRLSNQMRVGQIGHWENGSEFVSYFPGDTILFARGSIETLQGSQQIITGEKYHEWKKGTTEQTNVTNHHAFSVNSDFPSSVTSRFDSTSNATLEATTTDGTSLPNVQLKFSDPWLIDYPDPEYGGAPRNRGMDAPFKTVPSGDLGVNTAHQGIFLNQNEEFNDTDPIYRLRAPHYVGATDGIYAFSSWAGTDVNFEHSNNRETAVVFQQPGASVQATYTKISDQFQPVPFWLEQDEPLTIPAGAHIDLDPSFEIWVQYHDTLNLNGTVSDPVVLTSNGTEKWHGIHLYNDGVFQASNATIENAETGITLTYDDNVTFDAHDKVFERQTTFAHNTRGVAIEGGTPASYSGEVHLLFQWCNFTANDTAVVFHDTYQSGNRVPNIESTIQYSTFTDNAVGLWVEKNLKTTTVLGNTFDHNQTGIFIDHHWDNSLQYQATSLISGNDFAHNSDGIFLQLGNGAESIVRQNTFYDNNFGLFRSDGEDGQVKVYDNIVSNGDNGIIVSHVDPVEYNLTWNMSSQDLYPATGEGNFTADPQFQDPANDGFALQHSSPAIDAGKPDWDGDGIPYTSDPDDQDADGTRRDLGAHPYIQWKGNIGPVAVTWEGDVTVAGDLVLPEGGTLTIKPGTTIYVKPDANISIAGGTLFSEGNSTDSVVFRSSDPNRWAGIEITKGVGEFAYTHIKHAEKGLTVDQSQGQLNNSTVEQNTSGVILTHTLDYTLDANQISENSTGLQLLYSPITMKNNRIETNTGTGVYLYRSAATLQANTIQDNQIGLACNNLSNATLVVREDPKNLQINNSLTDNSEVGVTIDASSVPLLGNCKEDGSGNWTGGFNLFTGNKQADIDDESKDKIDARLNWWDGEPVLEGSGKVAIDPTADDQFGPPPGLGKSTLVEDTVPDTLNPQLLAATTLELDSAYAEAIQAYQTLIATAPDSEFAKTALGGIVRCYYHLENIPELLTNLTTLAGNYPESALAILAEDYAMTAQAMLTQYESALQTGESVYEEYNTSGSNPEAAAAVLFEQVLIASEMDSSGGLGKWNVSQHSHQTQRKLDMILAQYGGTEAAQLAQRLFNRSASKPLAPPIPTSLSLGHAYPNPFNPTTTITYGLPKPQAIQLLVFDLTGRRVKTLVNTRQAAGNYAVLWDGTNASGQPVSSGMYFYQLRTEDKIKVHKMLLIR